MQHLGYEDDTGIAATIASCSGMTAVRCGAFGISLTAGYGEEDLGGLPVLGIHDGGGEEGCRKDGLGRMGKDFRRLFVAGCSVVCSKRNE